MSDAEIKRNKRRVTLSMANLGAIEALRMDQADWGSVDINEFINHLISDGIRVRLLALGRNPVIKEFLSEAVASDMVEAA